MDKLDDIIDEGLAEGIEEVGASAVAGAIQAAVVQEGEVVYSRAAGRTRLDGGGQPVHESTPFDLASLTKPLLVGTLVMQAIAEGRIGLGEPLWSALPGWHQSREAESITWRQLANHTSGLPDWRPLYRDLPAEPTGDELEKNRRVVAERIRGTALETSPGSSETYSDLGYIVLGRALEELEGAALEELARSRIFEPLELQQMRFVSSRRGDGPLAGAVATERQPERGGMIVGRVHDRNAAALGGVAGHAGMFGTARELATFADRLLAVDRGEAEEVVGVDRETIRSCWSEPARGGHGHHVVGWDTPSGSPSSAGRGLQAGRTVGHLGFTGTSVWMERESGVTVVLLTNRVHPTRENDEIKPFRVAFHEATWEELKGER